MANPGRLDELLLPGADLLIEKVDDDTSRKLRYSASAVLTDNSVIGLNTQQTNTLARYLLKKRLVPTLEKSEIVSEEFHVGKNRFDFLMQENGKKFLLEVKSVTLSSNGISMFPDAITERGTRHLNELSQLNESGIKPTVLFISQGSGDDLFMPDYHTDLVFSQTLLSLKDYLSIIPIEIKWKSNLELSDRVKLLEIPWTFLDTRMADTGAYILVMHISETQAISIGSIGTVQIGPGYYLYVGSGMNGLSARVTRHLRKKKRLHWHVDFLRQIAGTVKAYPIRTPHNIETPLLGLAPLTLAKRHIYFLVHQIRTYLNPFNCYLVAFDLVGPIFTRYKEPVCFTYLISVHRTYLLSKEDNSTALQNCATFNIRSSS